MPDAYWDQHRDLTRDAYLRTIMTTGELRSAPGTQYAYSNYGYDLLGRIVEVVAGQPYEAFLRASLFEPAGMSQTGFAIPEFEPARVARYHDPVTVAWTSGGIEVSNPLERPPFFAPLGSGGLLSTVGDLHAWHEALLGETIATADMKAKLFTPVAGDYAYGWRVRSLPDDAKVIFHGGFDDSLGLAAGVYRIPAYHAAIIILSNTILNGDFRADEAALNAFSIMNGRSITLPPPSVAVDAARLDEHLGRYVLESGSEVEIVRRGRSLAIVTRDADAVRTLTFPEAYAPKPRPIAPPLERLLAEMATDDDRLLRDSLWSNVPFERVRERYRQWWAACTEELGPLRSTGLAHELTRDMEGETQLFIGLRFDRGVRVLRARRNASGRFLFDVPDEQRLELRLTPIGASTFQGWQFRLRTGPVVRFDAGDLEIAGPSGTVVTRGRRAPES